MVEKGARGEMISRSPLEVVSVLGTALAVGWVKGQVCMFVVLE